MHSAIISSPSVDQRLPQPEGRNRYVARALLLDVAVVQNTGTYAKTWWWYYGMTEQELQNLATANDARIVAGTPMRFITGWQQ